MATIAEILYVWAKLVNWRERRKQKKEMEGYQAVPEDLIFFRPVEPTDLNLIKKLEVSMPSCKLKHHITSRCDRRCGRESRCTACFASDQLICNAPVLLPWGKNTSL